MQINLGGTEKWQICTAVFRDRKFRRATRSLSAPTNSISNAEASTDATSKTGSPPKENCEIKISRACRQRPSQKKNGPRSPARARNRPARNQPLPSAVQHSTARSHSTGTQLHSRTHSFRAKAELSNSAQLFEAFDGRLQFLPFFPKLTPQVACFFDSSCHRIQVPFRLLQRRHNFRGAHRRRHRRMRKRAHAVDGRERLPRRILVRIKVNAALWTLAQAALGGKQIGMLRVHDGCDSFYECARLRERVTRLDRHKNMESRRARRFRKRLELRLVEYLQQYFGQLDDRGERRVRRRIQVEKNVVRIFQAADAARPRIVINASEVR